MASAEAIATLYNQGLNATQVGRETGISRQSVLRKLRAEGIEIRNSRPAALSEETKQQIRQMSAQGHPTRAIAEHLGVSVSTVWLWLSRAVDHGDDLSPYYQLWGMVLDRAIRDGAFHWMRSTVDGQDAGTFGWIVTLLGGDPRKVLEGIRAEGYPV